MFLTGDTKKLYKGSSQAGWGTYINGFNVDLWKLNYQFLQNAYAANFYYDNSVTADFYYAYFDTTTRTTWIPTTYYDFIMAALLKSSVGYYFDPDLKGYVTSCN